MSGDIEAIGDAMTGALAAGAVEPRHGDSTHGSGGRCLNCGTFLTGPYCARCGQNTHTHRSIGAFGHDFLHGVLHFEGKLWRTLPMLLWRPGELTRRYINGERARFFSPLALFLFAVFLTFAVFSIMGTGLSMPGGTRTEAAGNLSHARTALDAELRRTRQELEAARRDRAPPERIASLESDIASLNAMGTIGTIVGGESETKTGDGGGNARVSSDPTVNLNGLGAFGAVLEKAVRKLASDPHLLAYKMQANAYKFAWALIPLSVPFLWLLYPFSRRFGLYDHLVFVTYSLSFMLLLAILLRIGLAIGLPAGIEWLILLIYPPIHIYRQLRGTYRGSRIGALLRTGLLLLFSLTVLLIFGSTLLALGAF